jgi:Zn ribbon nucleic-acid-binding protein
MDRLLAAKQARAGAQPAEVVDLTTGGARPRQEWGRPGRCPACGGRGYLDHIDLVDRVMYQHCTECGHQWQVSEAEILAANQD